MSEPESDEAREADSTRETKSRPRLEARSTSKSGGGRRVAEFVPVPSLEEQIAEAHGLFDHLYQQLSSGSAVIDESDLRTTISDIETTCHKLFADTKKCVRSAGRAHDSAQVAAFKDQLLTNLDELSKCFDDLNSGFGAFIPPSLKLLPDSKRSKKKDQRVALSHSVEEPAPSVVAESVAPSLRSLSQFPPSNASVRFPDDIPSPMLLPVYNAIQSVHFALLDDAKSLTASEFTGKDNDFTERLFLANIDEFTGYVNQLILIQRAVLTAIPSLNLESSPSREEPSDPAYLLCKSLCAKVRGTLKSLYPVLTDFIRIFSPDSGDPPDMTPTEFDAETVDDGRIRQFFDERMQSVNDLYADLEKSYAAADDTDTNRATIALEPLQLFLKAEADANASDVMSDLNNFWRFAHEKKLEGWATETGALIFSFLSARAAAHDSELRLADVSKAYFQAVDQYDPSAERLSDLLQATIGERSSDIEDLRTQQLRNLERPPPPDEPKIAAYGEASKGLARELHREVLELVQAISDGRRASDLDARRGGPIEDIYETFDVEENEKARLHVTALEKLLRRVTRAARKAKNSVENSALRKAKSAEPEDSPADRAQQRFLEQALLFADEELLGETRGLVTKTIRKRDFQSAQTMHANLQDVAKKYRNHLTDLKTRALEKSDLATAREMDQKLEDFLNRNDDELVQCLCEGLEELVDATVRNYKDNCERISEEFKEAEDRELAYLDETARAMEENSHIPQLVLLGKKEKIALTKEEQRRIAAFDADEEEVRQLVGKGDPRRDVNPQKNGLQRRYKAAEAAKKDLDQRRADDLKSRKDAVTRAFTQQKRELLAKFKGELAALEANFETVNGKLTAQKERELQDQEVTLRGSIDRSIQQQLHFSHRLLPLDLIGKRKLAIRFEKCARKVCEDKEVLNLVFPPSERKIAPKRK
jgi:hypothetical protein